MFLKKYMHWLHTQWPAGNVEKLPEIHEDGATNVQGLFVVGDLTGIPLLKFSAHSGARVVRHFLKDPDFQNRTVKENVKDVVIVGGGVSGTAAIMEAQKVGLDALLIESTIPFSTIENFPKGKPIYTYPADMTPDGDLQFSDRSNTKESLLEELHDQAREIHPLQGTVNYVRRKKDILEVHLADDRIIQAHRVVVAIGRSGSFRELGIPGECMDKVFNRLHDPADFADKKVLIVGGGDSALEAAIALADAGATVSISYRKSDFSRPKPENVERLKNLGNIRLYMGSKVKEITPNEVHLTDASGETITLPNDGVFTLIGRKAPLDFFRKSGVKIRGEWGLQTWVTFLIFFTFCIWMYHWKGLGFTLQWINPARWVSGLHGAWNNPAHILGVLKSSYSQPWVYYTTIYALVVIIYGFRRMQRRKTSYVKTQTLTLMAIQIFPLYIIPCILLPWAYHNGFFDGLIGKWIMNEFFPGGPGDFWRAFGLILAWPLLVWNVFTEQPLAGWLVISFIQTFIVIPMIVYHWGKGAYCGWICSCGALAETLGDTHRNKMPHGPVWNRLNMIGQVILFMCFLLLAVRILGWIFPESEGKQIFNLLAVKIPLFNYKYLIDLWLSSIIGVGLYFHFSGRVWCRFACPLAALMHIYARFSRFRIFADKKKCISCNVCTSVCHQGIDIMNFANKGLPMADPQCVRCSACVQSCPTQVLKFGKIRSIFNSAK